MPSTFSASTRVLVALAVALTLSVALGISAAYAARPAAAASPATFTSPTQGQTDVNATQPFTWSSAAGAQGYYLTVGTTVGAYDVLASGELPASQTSYVPPVALPTGQQLYARLYTKANGQYAVYTDVSFTAAAAQKARFTSPLDGQTGVDATEPFTWSTVAGAQGYYLTVGRTAGAYDVLASGELPASSSSYTPPVTVPTGETLHARIYTKLNGAYGQYEDITFVASIGGRAKFTSPTDGQPAVDGNESFTWSTVAGAQGYYLTVGTTAGAHDVLASGELPASRSSYTPPAALPAGRTLHARIYTKLDGAYSRYNDITFTVSSPPPALTTSGNAILANGEPFTFHGVNRDSLTWGTSNWSGCGGDGHFTAADFDRIAAWKVTAVRLPLSQANWLGRRCDAQSYMQMVDAAVAKANARGMYAILDLHWSDVGGQSPCDANCPSGQQPMPDADSRIFWAQVAQRYANRPGVIFNLYNEPHDVPWSCWRNGGCQLQSSQFANGGSQVTYTAVGMQELYDIVRATGASNLVLVAGLDWAYDLSGVGAGYALNGTNIAYDTHVYVAWHSTTADWDAHFGDLAATKPVTATEFGSADCSTTYTAPLLDYFQARGIGWTIWSWNAPGSCEQPSVLASHDGTPLAGQGQLIYDRLAALAG